MPTFHHQKICSEILENLSSRTREVLSRRFGLEKGRHPPTTLPLERAPRETLEAIGKSYDVTRERVRQIEEEGISKSKLFLNKYQKVFQYFTDQIKKWGGLKKEDILLAELGDKWKNEVNFLLVLNPQFERIKETEGLYALWLVDKNSLTAAKKTIEFLYNWFNEKRRPAAFKEITVQKPLLVKNLTPEEKSFFDKDPEIVLLSYLEISKRIQKNKEGFYGPREWPEINPRGIKDKAYIVFKKLEKPLHFNEVAKFIPETSLQTVHNELIRDSRFVLVGRGIYALREWGYEEGDVKDIILKILKEAQGPVSKEEILTKVLEQRMVKTNTVFLNLGNKKYFLRNPQGGYILNNDYL